MDQKPGMMTRELMEAMVTMVNKPLAFELQNINPEHPMIQGRGISIETARQWGVGFYRSNGKAAPMDDRIVFPLSENGLLIGYVGRATLAGQQPKWLPQEGLQSTFLFGLERCDPAKPLELVKSPWAVLWLWQKGVKAAALMAGEMTENQERSLASFGTIRVAIESDGVETAKAAPIMERLRRTHRVVRSRSLE
jgi:hypothetical protein